MSRILLPRAGRIKVPGGAPAASQKTTLAKPGGWKPRKGFLLAVLLRMGKIALRWRKNQNLSRTWSGINLTKLLFIKNQKQFGLLSASTGENGLRQGGQANGLLPHVGAKQRVTKVIDV